MRQIPATSIPDDDLDKILSAVQELITLGYLDPNREADAIRKLINDKELDIKKE